MKSWKSNYSGGCRMTSALRQRVTRPTRVVTKTDGGQVGYATTPSMAAEAGITPDIVFVRNDGWSLGARRRDALAAHRLWDHDWVGFADLATGKFYWKDEPTCVDEDKSRWELEFAGIE